ncbi:MAG TPA: response regulator [Opitutus sp.]|nr:response regulator [Opitutus sp.]
MPSDPTSPPFDENSAAKFVRIGGWELDFATKRLACTAQTRRILEVDEADELPPGRMLDFCDAASRASLLAAFEAAARDGRDFDLELPFVTGAGRRIHVRVTGSVESRDGIPARLIGVLQDVTHRHERRDAQRRLELEALETDKAETLATFAGGVAHDFNNLLTGIMGYHELIACELGENKGVQDYIGHARDACLRARDLLEQVLTFSHETASVHRTSIELGPLLESARQQLGLLLPAGVAIDAPPSSGLPRVSGNAAQLRLAVLNLAVHAARHLESAGGTLHLRLRRAGREDSGNAAFAILPPGNYACISVANVPDFAGKETKRNVFERSFTTSEMRADNNLGVAVVFRIVRAHRGAVGCERAPDGGMEFRLYLPFAAPSIGAVDDKTNPEGRGQGEMIFVVDDEETVATFIRYALQAKGYRVQSFGAAEECLASLEADPGRCDLLITDQGMPGLSGVDLVARGRRLAPRLRALVISGNQFAVPPYQGNGSPLEIVQKPFTTEELALAVQRILHIPTTAK